MPPKGRPKLALSQNERLIRQAELKRQARQRKRSAQKAKSVSLFTLPNYLVYVLRFPGPHSQTIPI